MSQKPRKLQRVSIACDFCNRRSIKCSQSEDPLERCQNCVDFDVPCTFDRPTKRRGVKPGTRASGRDPQVVRAPVNHTVPTAAAPAGGGRASGPSTFCSPYRASISGHPWSTFDHGWSAAEGNDDDGLLHNSWKAFAIACDRQIRNLLQVCIEIVYPIFPLFHMPSFIDQVNRRKHLCNQGLFASTMAACSLVAARARDGALYSGRWDRDELIDPQSETFFVAARDSIPQDLAAAKGIHYMRACAILAIVSIQNGQIKDMQKYSGLYHTLTSMDGLFDERLWPKDLSPIETEERRRLFWSIYTRDIYSTVVWGGVIRYREAHSLVRYPSELDDEFIIDLGYGVPSVTSGLNLFQTGNVAVVSRQPTPWLRGWNFTTDLYRILEHLLRMVLLSAEEIGVERKCDVAGELLSVFSNVPIEYLKAISSPLSQLHHLGGIGNILGSVIEGNLSEVSYARARTLMLEMADLLQRLETGLHRASGTGERLRSQVDRIDSYMSTSLLLDQTSTSIATQVLDTNPEIVVPSAYEHDTPAAGASPGVGLEQMSQFQLPPEILSDWPWPVDSYNSEGFLPLAFE
ncbi:hypothetical protein F1880_006509 [Penicillium rolfsii]|nr:hypothetical protein F1880_006509 [Penicillium rolfsii]